MHSFSAAILATILGLTSTTEVKEEQVKPRLYGRVVILCIGIEQYEHGALAKLPAPAAETDARTLGGMLAAQYGYEAQYLIGPQATKEAILERIQTLSQELKAEDALIVFFSGHGKVIHTDAANRAGYLVPYDARLDLKVVNNPTDWRNEAIDMKSLMDFTVDIDAKHVLFLIDACNSGFMANRGTNLLYSYKLMQLMEMPSRHVITATNETQLATSRRYKGKELGIFTAAILEALESLDPWSSEAQGVGDLTHEIASKVANDSKGLMTPRDGSFAKAGSRMDGEFVFLPLTITEKEIARAREIAKRNPPVTNPKGRGVADPEPHVFAGILQREAERANLQTKMEDVIAGFEAIDYRYSVDLAKKDLEWRKRREQYEHNAAHGDVLAMLALHYCYDKGLGLDQRDESLAYHYARLGYNAGYEGGEHVLGRCHLNGIGVRKNEIAGFEMIRLAAQKKFPISLLQSGQDQLLRGDKAGAIRDWEEARINGVESASIYLANLKATPAEAVATLLPVAHKGNAAAQSALSWNYAKRIDPPMRAASAYWLEQAARNGLGLCQVYYALELIAGIPGAKMFTPPLGLQLDPDLEKAKLWVALAGSHPVEASSPDVLEGIANAYYYTTNDPMAQLYRQRLHALDPPTALRMLSQWYITGNQVRPPDPKNGYFTAWDAFHTGDSRAKLWLALVYLQDFVPDNQKARVQGGTTTIHHAMHFYILAADQRDPRTFNTAIEWLKVPAEMIRENPNTEFWRVFKEAYPMEVDRFLEYTRENPALPVAKNKLVMPSKPLAFGVLVEDANVPGEGVKDGGAVITGVQPGSPAAAVGLKKGDMLLMIDGKAMKSAKDVTLAIEEAGRTISIIVLDSKNKSVFSKDVRLNK